MIYLKWGDDLKYSKSICFLFIATALLITLLFIASFIHPIMIELGTEANTFSEESFSYVIFWRGSFIRAYVDVYSHIPDMQNQHIKSYDAFGVFWDGMLNLSNYHIYSEKDNRMKELQPLYEKRIARYQESYFEKHDLFVAQTYISGSYQYAGQKTNDPVKRNNKDELLFQLQILVPPKNQIITMDSNQIMVWYEIPKSLTKEIKNISFAQEKIEQK